MMDFFWQGLIHPLITPAHLMLLIAVSLLAGQQGWQHLKTNNLLLLAALSAGAALTLSITQTGVYETILLILAAITGLLIALQLSLPVTLTALLALTSGIIIGLDSAAPRIPGLHGTRVYTLLTGSVLSAATLSLLCSLIALSLRNILTGIILRVLGAWITAGAVMVLALYFSKAIRP